MISWEMVWDLPFKMLPSIVSLLLCWRNFNFTQIARGIAVHPDTCVNFERVKKDKYPCLESGITALRVVLGVISLGISLIILTHFSGNPRIANGGIFGGLIMVIFGLLYIQELNSGAFSLRTNLPRSRWRFFRMLGKNPALRSNILCLGILMGIHLGLLFL